MYSPQLDNSAPKYGMVGRQSKFHDEKVPGPGAYNPSTKLVTQDAPHYGVGTSPKIDKDKTTRRIVPGPGAYD
jgi:hypothetical protein